MTDTRTEHTLDLHELMAEATVRIDSAWLFPSVSAPESLAEALYGAEKLPAELDHLVEGWGESERGDLFDGDGYSFNVAFDELCCEAHNRGFRGWLAIAATPVFSYSKDGSASYSWGHYHTEMVFAPTADDLMRKAAEWADARHAKSREAG